MVKKKSKSTKLDKDLTIHFMPNSEVSKETTIGKIKKIMGPVIEGKIIILQGKLKADEEARLIENSMTLIDNLKGFQGIEIATVSNENERTVFEKIRHNIAKILIGEQDAITIIGPATIVKEIKRNPKKIELMLQRK